MFKSKWSLFIVLFIIALIEYYSFVAVNTATKNLPPKYRIPLLVLYIILAIAGWAGIYMIRSLSHVQFASNVKALMMAFIMGVFIAKLLMSTIMLLGDGYRLTQRLFSKKQNTVIVANEQQTTAANTMSRSMFLSRMSLLLGGLVLGTFVWGTTNRYRYTVKRLKLPIDGLPDGLKGLRILQISDVHAGSFDNPAAVQHGIDLIMAEQADLIVVTGDLVNDRAEEIVPYKNIFNKLKAPLGVYSTLGNHDYGDYVTWESDAAKKANLQALLQHQKDMGWKLMMNEHLVLEKNGERFALIGVENWGAKARFPKYGDLKKAYQGLENTDVKFKMLLSHDPSHWDAQVRKMYPDIDLTLSGHTHGMQFGVDLPWMKWSPVQYVYHQWAGLYSENKQHLYVNRGFGFIGYQGRVGILPEITVIELA